MLSIIINILLVIHVITSLLLLLVVLMQRPKSEGLGSAFGGGVTEDLFGAQTTTVLTKFTVYLGSAFFILTLTLAVLYAQRSRGGSGLQQELAKPVESAEVQQSLAPPANDAVAPEMQPSTTEDQQPAEATEAAEQEITAPAEITTEAVITPAADAQPEAVQDAGDQPATPAAPSGGQQ